MDTQITITPMVNQQGIITLSLTPDQYDEINRALVSYNKRREINRNQAAKRRGTSDPRACKPTLILGYPVSQTPLQIPIRTSFNTRLTPSPNHIVPQVLNLEKSVMG